MLCMKMAFSKEIESGIPLFVNIFTVYANP
jgi:hypothetical protein